MVDRSEETCIIVPPERLSAQTVDALLDEFILRKGTDYGALELSLEAKRARAIKQLEAGHVKIVYSPESESCTLLRSTEIGS
jgi:uncharacterized protein YheU (UPF0270 family)